jgi:hypothetical protein
MRRTFAVLVFTAVLASAAASFALLANDTRAATPADATFFVAANDGYGVAECLTSGSECGQVVADAWCEAQGYTRASSFGRTVPGDVTGSIRTVSATQREHPIAITCVN